MSWTIGASGTVDEIRQAIRDHEGQLRHFPQSERLLAHHVLGHMLSVAEEHDRMLGYPRRYVLTGNGSENHGGGWSSVHVDIGPDPNAGA